MKLLPVFGAAVTAAAMPLPAFPASAENSLSVTVPGDIDLNKSGSLLHIIYVSKERGGI